MATWRLRINARAWLSGSAAVLLTAAGFCRADEGGIIARCAASESKDARIACLEQALEAASAGAAGTPTEAPVPSEPAGFEPATAVPSEPAAEPAAAVPAQPEPRAVPSSSEPAPPGASFGDEQLEQPESAGEDAVFEATVVDFDFVGYKRLRVLLDNGQVWRQIDGDRTNLEWGLRDAATFDVELWEAGLGGYRMRVMPVDRIIRVERLQ